MSYRLPESVLKTSLNGFIRPRNVHERRFLYECNVTKVASAAKQVGNADRRSKNYLTEIE